MALVQLDQSTTTSRPQHLMLGMLRRWSSSNGAPSADTENWVCLALRGLGYNFLVLWGVFLDVFQYKSRDFSQNNDELIQASKAHKVKNLSKQEHKLKLGSEITKVKEARDLSQSSCFLWCVGVTTRLLVEALRLSFCPWMLALKH